MEQRKNYHGHRRLNTPQNRLKRAVSYRHTEKTRSSKKQKVQSLSGIGESVAQSVSKYFSVLMKKTPDSKESDSVFDEKDAINPKEEELNQENTPEETPKQNTRSLSRKEVRRMKKDKWVESMVTQPNASFFGTLFHPLRCLDRASRSRYISISSVKGLLWTIFAWLCFGLCTARLYVWKVYQMEFSIARYNFTENIWLAIRIALYGLAAGYVFMLGFYLYGKIKHRNVYYTKLMEGASLSSLPVAILFLICYLIMLKFSGAGTFLYVLCIVVAVCYKSYSLYRSTRFSWIEVSILGIVLMIVLFMIYQVYFGIAMKDLKQVYQLLNH